MCLNRYPNEIRKERGKLMSTKIQALIRDVYENAVSKGWYEKPATSLEKHMLMISEVSEATEAVREKKDDYYEENGKPEGEASELADVIIRIFDYVGSRNVNLKYYLSEQFFKISDELDTFAAIKLAASDLENIKCNDEIKVAHSKIEYHMSISLSISNASNSLIKGKNREFYNLAEAMVKIIYYATKNKWDIEAIVNKKHNFNKTREYKHGGKTC